MSGVKALAFYSEMPLIKGFIKNSLIEWEGKIVSIIFLSQCNLRCQYCHSPHLIRNHCDIESIPLNVVLDTIVKNRDWLDGVVISGGEPTIHDGLAQFIKAFRNIGVKIKLDTNGTNPDVIADLLDEGLVDYIAMDIKAPLDKIKYNEATGVICDIERIKRSIEVIMKRGVEYEFRTTICPKFLDKSDIIEIAQQIKGADRYILQSFRPNNCLNNELLNVTPYPLETMKGFAVGANRFVKDCRVRGEQKELVYHGW